MWIDITDSVSFDMKHGTNTVLGYTMTASPQLAAIVKSEAQESIAVRLVVDNIPYREGASIQSMQMFCFLP